MAAMVVVDALHGDSVAAVADELFGDGTGGAELQAFFDHAALEVKAAGGGGEEEEELEWLSNKDAFPAVETMAPPGARPRTKGARRARQVVAWSAAAERRCRHCGTESTPLWCEGPEGRGTLCNACGVRYKTGRLLPEYRPLRSPTFSPELHSNWHLRVLEMRRRRKGPAMASDGGEKAGEEPEQRLLNKGAFPEVETMAPAGARPRTKGVRRPRRVVAWSPPPPLPPTLSAPASGESRTKIHPWRTTTTQLLAASAAAPAGDGAPRGEVGLGVSAGGQVRPPPSPAIQVDPPLARAAVGQGQCRTVETPAAQERPPSLPIQVDPPLAPATAWQRRCWMKKTPRAPAAAAGGKWRCQHCGAEKTPQWRVGPEGPGTLCNACGVRHRKGRLVPEYRRLKSPTFSSELHSNRHHRVVEMRRQREQSAAKVAAAVGADGGSRQVED